VIWRQDSGTRMFDIDWSEGISAFVHGAVELNNNYFKKKNKMTQLINY
jgi:hypothetical protein